VRSQRAHELRTAREIASMVVDLIAALLVAAVVLLLQSCAADHGRIEPGEPIPVHLCDAMSQEDRDTWGFAAGDVNAEVGAPALWVGHGKLEGCGVYVCPRDRAAGVLVLSGGCRMRIFYRAGDAEDVARVELSDVVRATWGEP